VAQDEPSYTRCSAPTKAGGSCPKAAMAGKTTCWTHGTSVEERKVVAARRPSADRQGLPVEIADELERAETPSAVRAVLTKVGAAVLRGQLAPTTGRIVSQLAGQVLRSISDDIEQELKEIKELLAQHPAEEVRGWAGRRRKGGK